MLAAGVQLQHTIKRYAEEVTVGLDERLAPSETVRGSVLEAMRYSTLAGGKRFRPILCLLSAEICGADRASAMPAACAIEMVHTYSEIHDDLPAMDDDDLRRGQPSCHKAFGEAMAILAGDALLTEAFGVLARDVKDARIASRLAQELAVAAGAAGMVGGQALDIEAEATGSNEAALEKIHLRKTARLIEAAAAMGAISASAPGETLEHLREYGRHLGLAFQIADDLLDTESTSDMLGKTAGKDARANKLTYVSVHGIEEAKRQASREVSLAVEALAEFGPEADILRDLAIFAVERTR